MIIETCQRCGATLIDIMLASNPPIPRKECFSCGWYWRGEPEPIEYVPFGKCGVCVRAKTDNYRRPPKRQEDT